MLHPVAPDVAAAVGGSALEVQVAREEELHRLGVELEVRGTLEQRTGACRVAL